MDYTRILDLTGEVAVVTGAAGLIGRGVVQALAENNSRVILADSDIKNGKRITKGFYNLNLDVIFRQTDITDEKSVAALIRYINKVYGQLDIWINCAYPKTSDWNTKFEDLKSASWRKNVDMHLNGYMLCCRQAAEYMKKKKIKGSIINLASIYGILGPDFSIYSKTKMTMPAAYSAIKGGIINFTRYLASYYGKYNIRVNSLSCGGVYNKQPDKFVKRYTEKTLLKRMAKIEDVACAVLYLASDASGYVTGHNLVVDGGLSAI